MSVPFASAAIVVIVFADIGTSSCRQHAACPAQHCGRRLTRSLEGSHPWISRTEDAVELFAAGDAQLRVGAREVAFDRLDREIELLSDLTVAAPVPGKPHGAEFARRQRFQADSPIAAGTRAGDMQLFSGSLR